MKTLTANKVRARVIEAIMAYFVESDEDCGMIASNSFNFPICEDGEEGWVEIVVKIPKDTEDSDEGYSKREDYQMKCAAKVAKQAEKERKAAERKSKSKSAKQAG